MLFVVISTLYYLGCIGCPLRSTDIVLLDHKIALSFFFFLICITADEINVSYSIRILITLHWNQHHWLFATIWLPKYFCCFIDCTHCKYVSWNGHSQWHLNNLLLNFRNDAIANFNSTMRWVETFRSTENSDRGNNRIFVILGLLIIYAASNKGPFFYNRFIFFWNRRQEWQ